MSASNASNLCLRSPLLPTATCIPPNIPNCRPVEKNHGFFFCRRQIQNQHSDGNGNVLSLRSMCQTVTVTHAPALIVHYLVS
ncbi:hypothetical protein J6590_082349 [Homalodisca vitripennis]|nr:hypothetical protein J6590_082349 [Homalodisca vitripennis]